MSTVLAQLFRWIRQPAQARADYPRTLLETAGARVGANPRQAEELRHAAAAYISVVR